MKYRSRSEGQCGCRVGTSRSSLMWGLTVLGVTVDEKQTQHLSIVQRCSRYWPLAPPPGTTPTGPFTLNHRGPSYAAMFQIWMISGQWLSRYNNFNNFNRKCDADVNVNADDRGDNNSSVHFVQASALRAGELIKQSVVCKTLNGETLTN